MYASRTDAVDALMCKELRKGLGLGDTAKGWSPGRRMEEEMGSPRGSTKRAEAAQPLPRETEALRTGEGKTESALLTWQMDFPVEKSPAHSMLHGQSSSCLFHLCITVHRTCSQRSSHSFLEMEGFKQRCSEDK